MAKLSAVLEGKAAGEWFTPDDIEKQTVTIVESLGMDAEIREHDTGKEYEDSKTGKKRKQKYYCIKITDGKATKDLHLTWTGLTQLAEKLPKNEAWLGYQFRIDEVQKNTKDKPTGKLSISVIGKVDISQQQLFQETTQAPIADPAGKILEKLKPAGKHGLTDDGFWSMAAAECGGAGVAVRVVDKLKAEGKVLNQNGFWTAT